MVKLIVDVAKADKKPKALMCMLKKEVYLTLEKGYGIFLTECATVSK